MTEGDFEIGKTYTYDHESDSEYLGYIDKISRDDVRHYLLVSRLPQRRLLEHIDLDKVETYWITTQDVAGSIQPSLDQLEDLLVNRVQHHSGFAFIEGIEWLVSLHGFSNVLNFVMRVKDSLHRKAWSVIFVVTPGIFSDIELAKWTRESGVWTIPKREKMSQIEAVDTMTDLIEPEVSEPPLSEDGSSKLAFLIRIPREGYSKEIARRRILQWRRMGLDVSEAEPALFMESDDDGYELYKTVEEKVRTAVELDNRLDLLLEKGFKSDVTKLRFRVRQLTGFDEVEARINELI
ncbi:MAG: DUF835 domain-containing protein [Candidatus Thermoplasmatota archaeon]|nr:DUF835 domain-containing protein [Candidatus Thermoplasmatota archaeon]